MEFEIFGFATCLFKFIEPTIRVSLKGPTHINKMWEVYNDDDCFSWRCLKWLQNIFLLKRQNFYKIKTIGGIYECNMPSNRKNILWDGLIKPLLTYV